jgi:hypothetical protein
MEPTLPLPPQCTILGCAEIIRISALVQPLPFPVGILQGRMTMAMIDDSFAPGKYRHVQVV